MTYRTILSIALAVGFSPIPAIGTQGTSSAVADAVKALAAARPKFRWEVHRAVVADVNCDGRLDYAIPGAAGKTYAVAVVFGPVKKGEYPTVLEFGLGDATKQDSLCSDTADLKMESLDYDPSGPLGGPLPGFRRSTTCRGLVVIDGACDSFHIFWNHDAKRLEWWRL